MTKIRLNKYLSNKGICSRRKADLHILNGNITVNDNRVKAGTLVEPSSDIIKLFGKDIANNNDACLKYFAFYKPKGVITTLKDEMGRKSLGEYLDRDNGLKPVGRLDKDSEGLMIITNDGEAIYELSHPKFEHDKEYYVEAHMSENFSMKDLGRLTRGVMIDKIRIKAVSINHVMVEKKKNLLKFNLVLNTGYNRQIRRMSNKIGLSVTKIVRIRFGKLSLYSLNIRPGDLKEIKLLEIK